MPLPSMEGLCRRWFDEVWNQGMEETVDALFVEGGVGHGLGQNDNDVVGPPGFKVFLRNIRSAFPDVHIEVDDLVVDRDKAAIRLTLTGTHRGNGLGIAPTGRHVNVKGIVIIRVANGQIVEAWNSWDQLGMLQQLGALPSDDKDRFLTAQA